MTKSTFARNHHWETHGPYWRHEPRHARHPQRSAPNNATFIARGFFRTFKDLIRGADQHGLDHNSLSASALAAVWSKIPRVWDTARDIQPREQNEFEWRLTRFVQHTHKMISDHARDFRPQDISAVFLGIAKVVKELRGGRGARLETIFRELLDATNSRVEHNLFQRFASASARHLLGFNAQSTSNLAYAYALIKHSPALEDGSNLFDLLARRSMELLGEFKPQGFSNLVWAFTTVKEYNPELFAKVADAVVAQDLKLFKPQEVTNIVWAYATAEAGRPDLFHKVADDVVARDLNSFKPQDLSMIVWAYATAKVTRLDLFDKVADDAVARDLKVFNPQNLANIVWAFATAEVGRPDLFRKVADDVVARDLKSFNAQPQGLANIVWAYATAQVKHHDLFRKVADDVVARELKTFNAQDFANIVWAYATAEVKHPGLFHKISGEVVARDLKSFKPQNLANIVWAFATAEICHPRLFDKISGASIELQKKFNPQETANLLWAYASVGQIPLPLFKSFSTTAAALIERCNSQDLANIAWAFAVANVDAPTLLSERFVDALIQKSDTFGVEDLRQLHQWKLWRVEMNARVRLPPSIQDRCCEAFTSSSIHVSGFQKKVVCELSAMGLQPKDEVLLPSGYSLDALVQVDGQSVGIEVDGPYHFIDGKPTGKTLLKHRQIVSIDRIRILSVPFWEWDRFGDDQVAKRRYLRSKLGI